MDTIIGLITMGIMLIGAIKLLKFIFRLIKNPTFKTSSQTKHKKSKIAIMVIAVTLLLGYIGSKQPQTTNTTTDSSPFSNTIKTLHDNVKVTISQDQEYTLPSQVLVKMTDDDNRLYDVQWDKTAPTTFPVGETVMTGKLTGYTKSIPVKYTITVLPTKTVEYLGDVSTVNSEVIYKNIDTSSSWVWAKVTKDGQTDDQFFKTDNGIFNGKVYLHSGPGTYTVKFNTGSTRYGDYVQGDNTYTITNNDTRDMNYALPSQNAESDNLEVISLANEITRNCYNDIEKAKAIHDWVASNIAYDTNVTDSTDVSNYQCDALTVLHKKVTICEGYANLTAALSRAAGVKSKVIEGNANGGHGFGGHAWNEDLVDGNWILEDTTWDAGTISDGKFTFNLSEDYFNPEPDKFSKDHHAKSEHQ